MATATLQDCFDAARGNLSDTQIAGGEIFTNAYLQVFFGQAYRDMYNCLLGSSKRIQRRAYLVLPAYTSVLIPQTYKITDFSEPEMIEERPATAGIPITSTSNATPVVVTTVAPHGLTGITQGQIGGVAGSNAPLGQWWATVTGASTFSLNGSAADGAAGTGGNFWPAGQLGFQEVMPVDLARQALDGNASSYLGRYLWAENVLQFRGATQDQELRITYYASGTAPTIPSTVINIDNAIDVLATATAAAAALSKGWLSQYQTLQAEAYGDGPPLYTGGLFQTFRDGQILARQRGPLVRRRAFTDRRSRWGGISY